MDAQAASQIPTRRRGPLPVVIDTNVFLAERWFTSRRIDVLAREAQEGRLQLCVPEIVVLEVAAHAARRLDVIVTQHLNAAAELVALGEAATAPSPLEPTGSFDVELRRRLQRLDAEVLPMPTVSHAVLGARAARHEAPFRDAGRGYKDALIWYTVLALLEARGAPVAVITADAKDFVDKDGRPAPALATELSERGADQGAVTFHGSLGEFIGEVVDPLAELTDRVSARIAADEQFQETVTALMIAKIEEEPGMLKGLLRQDLAERGEFIRFRGFEPADAPRITSAFATTGDPVVELAITGRLEVALMQANTVVRWRTAPIDELAAAGAARLSAIEVDVAFEATYDQKSETLAGIEPTTVVWSSAGTPSL